MTTFDDSPRATKRRKTGPHDSSNLSLSSRAFRAVKEAVFGKSIPKSSPSSRNGTGSYSRPTPVQNSKRVAYENSEENVDWDVPDSDNEGASTSVKPSTQTITSTSKSRRSGRHGKIHPERDWGDGSSEGFSKILATPTKTKRGSHNLRSEIHDPDELGLDAPEGQVAETYKRSHNSANSLEGARGGQRRQRPKKIVDEEGSKINANINHPIKQGSSPTSERDISIQLNVSNGDPNVLKPGPSYRRRRQEPDAEAVDPNKITKIAQTPPITRSGQKRGLQEVPQTDDATADTSPATPSNRKRGRPRKQPINIEGNVQDDELAFKNTPSRYRFTENLPNQLDSNSEIPSPASAEMMPGRKYRSAVEATLEPSIVANGVISKDVIGGALEPNIDNFSNDHLKWFQEILKKHSPGSLTALKTLVMDGLTGKRRLPLVNLEEEYQKVRQLVEQTVLAGEGNSMLIVGSRGTAKTTLVGTVIEELATDHREDFHVVRLNGFIHTDDKLALREIWRQLGREMDVENDAVGARSNYADTLTSLLALLSHPSDASETMQDHIAKSVIFVIDEFDLFASHPRQTLLYNLFDVAQSRNAPIAVLGLTTKVDIVDSLEKRVKSRFSQRYVHLSLPRTYAAFQDICKSVLACQNPAMSTLLNRGDATFPKLHTAWMRYVDALFSKDPAFDAFLLNIYTRTKSVPSFLTACLLPVSLLSPNCIPTGLEFAAQTFLPPDSKLHLLPGLSDLELSLLIATARLDIILDTDMCNFNMAYDEYQQLASRVKAQSSAAGQTAVGGGARVWGKEVASGAWERLADLELILPAIGGGKGETGRANGRMWRVDVGLEEIGPSVSGLSGVMKKWCKEI